MSRQYLSTAAAAAVLGVHPNTMRAIVSDGEIPWTNIARKGRPRIRIAENDLHEWMERNKSQAGDEVSA